MKTQVRFFFLLLLAVLLIQPAYGQRLLRTLKNKVEERVEKKVEERAEKKVDEAIDKQLDKLEEALEENQGEEPGKSGRSASTDEERNRRMQNILQNMGMSGEPVPVADSYNFDHLVQMHIESFDKNGNKESDGEFITHFNPETHSMAYEMISGNVSDAGQGMFIIDTKNGATIILSDEDGKKTGIVYGMGSFFELMGQNYEEEVDLPDTQEAYMANPNITKTGKTKTIAGYKCEEYKYNDETSESSVWITKDMKMNTRDFFSNLFKTSLYSQGIPWGYMMEVTSIDKETGEKSFMQVTRVDENSNTRFPLTDYEITNLGSFQIPSETKEEQNE